MKTPTAAGKTLSYPGKAEKKSGNATPVFHVTGGDTVHSTNKDVSISVFGSPPRDGWRFRKASHHSKEIDDCNMIGSWGRLHHAFLG